MNKERKKQLALIVGFVLLAIIVWLLTRGSSKGRTVVGTDANGNPIFGDVIVPGINIPGRKPFTLPDFGAFAGVQPLSAIGACCADCSKSGTTRQSYAPASSITFVTNEASKGPNVYNYYPTQPAPYSGTLRSWGSKL